ncbi:MAG: hypothetical protein HQL69_09480 [Magnetococcales bacterium]|nr:hypothetical protein [Magnetococcales bacterium]
MNLRNNHHSGYDKSLDKPISSGQVLQQVISNNLSLDLKHLHNLLNETQPDLQTTIESLSTWLNTVISVKLVAYWNPRTTLKHLCCEEREENSTTLKEKSRDIIDGPLPRIRHWRQENWLFHLWIGNPLDKWDRILVVESGEGMSIDESNKLMEETMNILHKPLKNALNSCC